MSILYKQALMCVDSLYYSQALASFSHSFSSDSIVEFLKCLVTSNGSITNTSLCH